MKKEKEEIENKIKDIINNIQPYLNMDGGNIEFVKYEDNYLYVKLNSHCNECLLRDEELDNGLLNLFQEEIPEIKGIINVPL